MDPLCLCGDCIAARGFAVKPLPSQHLQNWCISRCKPASDSDFSMLISPFLQKSESRPWLGPGDLRDAEALPKLCMLKPRSISPQGRYPMPARRPIRCTSHRILRLPSQTLLFTIAIKCYCYFCAFSPLFT